MIKLVFSMEKSAYSSFLGIIFCLKPDRLLAEIVCDILFVFEIHSITKSTLDLLIQRCSKIECNQQHDVGAPARYKIKKGLRVD